MITLTDDVKEYLEPAIRAKCGNRTEVGLFAFTGIGDNKASIHDVFSYTDTISISALINKQYSARDAAAYVRLGLVDASPHYAGHDVEGWVEHQHEMHVGFFRLTDGSVWSVSADIDTRAVTPDQIEGDFLVVGTRGTSIVNEDPANRVRHLLTECDARGLPNRTL